MARNFVTGGTDRIGFAAGLPDQNNAQSISFSCWFQCDVNDSNKYIFNINDIGDNGQGLTVWISATGKLNYTQKHVSASTYCATTDGDIPIDSSWHHIFITHTGSFTATEIELYVDNVLLVHTLDQDGSGLRVAAVGDWMIGGRWVGDDNRTWDGGLAKFGWWDGVQLTAGERKALSDGFSPQLIRPSSLIFAPDLVRDAINPMYSHTSTITGTTIVQHPRTMQPTGQILQFPVSTGPGLINLVIADALHAHAADNVDLVQQNVLAIAEALHGHTSDNVALTQQNLLAIADALHGHAGDNVVLTVAGALTIAEAFHAHTADNVALTQQNVLAVADALHAHAADAIQLTQQHVLIISDALHAHIADNVSLLDDEVIPLASGVFVINAKSRTLIVSASSRTITITDRTRH